MSDRTPDFDELIGRDDPDRARLEGVHELLLAAGPPPELPPSLEEAPPEKKATVIPIPRRRFTAIAAVAVAAMFLLGIGYAIGARDKLDTTVQTIPMSGPAGASASIALRPKDAAGNWPMVLEAQGLPRLRKGETYTLWLTKAGKLVDTCGTFVAGADPVEVPLNAPYKIKEYDGWVVVRTGSSQPFVLRTSSV